MADGSTDSAQLQTASTPTAKAEAPTQQAAQFAPGEAAESLPWRIPGPGPAEAEHSACNTSHSSAALICLISIYSSNKWRGGKKTTNEGWK